MAMNYAKAFRILRAAFGLQQAELSTLLRVSPSQISLIESGKRQPSSALIDDAADFLQVPRSLIDLLASDLQDIEGHPDRNVGEMARSLLTLLASASPELPQRQPRLPFSKSKE
jgi:transcriptional regulator with XRE-family HTH domain